MSDTPPYAYAMAFWFAEEGDAYTNHPNDPGGPTKFGISQKGFPAEDIQGMSQARAVHLMRWTYWVPLKCDKLPPLTARALFDFAGNCGKRTAAKHLQREVGSVADGKIGPKTLASARAYGRNGGDLALAHALILRRARYYVAIVRRRPALLDFLGGWMARCLRLQAALHEEK